MKNASGVLILAAAMAGCASLAGCGKGNVPAAAAPAGAAALTPATGAFSGHVVKLMDGLELSGVKNREMIHPQFELTPDDVDSEVMFAVAVNDEKHVSSPVVLKKIGETWRALELGEAKGQEWVYAAAGPGDGEVWGVLDVRGDGDAKAGQMTIVRSTDNGLTWTYFSAVKKMAGAHFDDFAMVGAGTGRLTMRVHSDDDAVVNGYYHYKTADGGRTWTGPTTEPDDTVEADSLKRFSTVKEAIKGTEAENGADGAAK